MADTHDLAAKLYFFSAFYGELNRALNQLWSPELGLAHLVLSKVHEQITGRVNMPTPGAGIPAGFPAALDGSRMNWQNYLGRSRLTIPGCMSFSPEPPSWVTCALATAIICTLKGKSDPPHGTHVTTAPVRALVQSPAAAVSPDSLPAAKLPGPPAAGFFSDCAELALGTMAEARRSAGGVV